MLKVLGIVYQMERVIFLTKLKVLCRTLGAVSRIRQSTWLKVYGIVFGERSIIWLVDLKALLEKSKVILLEWLKL